MRKETGRKRGKRVRIQRTSTEKRLEMEGKEVRI